MPKKTKSTIEGIYKWYPENPDIDFMIERNNREIQELMRNYGNPLDNPFGKLFGAAETVRFMFAMSIEKLAKGLPTPIVTGKHL